MNANVTTEIRELTAQELDQVNGGMSRDTSYEAGAVFFSLSIATAVVAGIGAVLEWLFG